MWFCLLKSICVISCVNFQRMCSLFTQESQPGRLRNNTRCQHHLHMFAPGFRSHEDLGVPVPGDCRGDCCTFARDGLCGLEFVTPSVEVDPRPTALRWPQEVFYWVTPGFLNSCHAAPKSHGNVGVQCTDPGAEKHPTVYARLLSSYCLLVP